MGITIFVATFMLVNSRIMGLQSCSECYYTK